MKVNRLITISVLFMIMISGCGPKVIVPPLVDLAEYESVGLGGLNPMIPLKDRLIVAMKELFGDDQKRISHALSVLAYVEEMHAIEGGDLDVVVAAAVLHDIGINEAERKHGSSDGKYQEIEGSPIARGIMEELELDEELIDHVCRIVGSHHTGLDIETIEFRILWDSDWLVNISNKFPNVGTEKTESLIERTFKTDSGKKKAYELFIR